MLLAKEINPKQEAYVQAVKKRLKYASEVLGSMKNVKMLGLTSYMLSSMQSLREQEMQAIQKYNLIQAFNVALCGFLENFFRLQSMLTHDSQRSWDLQQPAHFCRLCHRCYAARARRLDSLAGNNVPLIIEPHIWAIERVDIGDSTRLVGSRMFCENTSLPSTRREARRPLLHAIQRSS